MIKPQFEEGLILPIIVNKEDVLSSSDKVLAAVPYPVSKDRPVPVDCEVPVDRRLAAEWMLAVDKMLPALSLCMSLCCLEVCSKAICDVTCSTCTSVDLC